MDEIENVTTASELFTAEELDYLRSQKIVRLATSRPDGSRVDVAPLTAVFDGEHFRITGYDIAKTMKYFHIKANPNVALVWDDLASVEPWVARGVKVHGRAHIEDAPDGRNNIVVEPLRKWSWGVNGPAFDRTGPLSTRAERSPS